MQITLKLYASLMEYLPAAAVDQQVQIEVAEGAGPLKVLEDLGVPIAQVHLVLVNGVFVPPSQRSEPLKPGDTLAVWPAVAGG